jgi:hypothetical protein
MALWGNKDEANNAPKYKGVLAGSAYSTKYTHVKTEKTIVIPSGAGYNNTDILVVSVGTPDTTYANARFVLVTNATGYIQSLQTVNLGSFSANASNTQYAITNATFGTATGNTTVTGFSGVTYSPRVAGMQMYANATMGAFTPLEINGIYGVSTNEIGTTTGGSSPGWVLETRGTGPVTGATVTGGVNVVTGETITLSNGSANGILTVTANGFAGNSTSNAVGGNITSVAVTSGGSGWFTNTHVVTGFNREKHLSTLQYTGTATGYSNTDTIRISNATINATATVSTNATGGTLTFVLTNLGLFSNTIANNQVVITALAANGANSAGSGATFTANLVASTGGTVTITTTGGRSNRKQYENLAIVRGMANNASSNGGGSTLA